MSMAIQSQNKLDQAKKREQRHLPCTDNRNKTVSPTILKCSDIVNKYIEKYMIRPLMGA